jgi:putative ABC transport system permease protein
LLERLCAPHLLEEVLGDLHERYYLRVQREGENSARRQYWQEAFSYLRPYLLKRQSPYATTPLFTDMLKNYLTIATRNLLKYKGFSTINVTGLGLGMACCMLLVLFIEYELSYDTYHKNYPRIFRMTYLMSSGEHKQNIKSPEPLARTLQAELPEVIKAGRLFPYQDVPVRVDDGHFIEKDLYAADQAIVDIFSFRVKSGDPSGLLKDPASVVLNETTAGKYFNGKNPVGKTLLIFNQPMRVTGVIEDMPANSHFHANVFISYNTFPQSTSDNWGWTDPRTYFLVKEGVTPDAITQRMPALAKKHGAEYFTFKAEPLSKFTSIPTCAGNLNPTATLPTSISWGPSQLLY